jgi:hypothetical protein
MDKRVRTCSWCVCARVRACSRRGRVSDNRLVVTVVVVFSQACLVLGGGMGLLRARVDAPLPSASARAKISLHVCKKYSRVPVSPAIVLLTTPDVLECQHGLRFTRETKATAEPEEH